MTGARAKNHPPRNDSHDDGADARVWPLSIGARGRVASRHQSDFRMIESVEIENFRGFRELRLSGFRRINIVVGDNGAGKTAFLEALYAAAGQSMENVVKLRAWRGVSPPGQIIGARNAYLAFFGDLFTNFDLSLTINVTILWSEGHRKTMKIFASREPQVLLPLDVEKSEDLSSPVTFEWSEPGGNVPYSVTPQLQAQGLVVPQMLAPNRIEVGLLAARTPVHAPESAQYFSDLSIANKEKPFIVAMRRLFTDVETINVELFGGTPSLFASLKYHDRKYPIHVLSDGMNKIAAILLGITSKPKGIFMIDEIESGLYFKRQNLTISRIRDMAVENKTQIFASTHSLEFLNALSPIMSKHPEDFSLIRIYQEKGWGKATILDGKEAIALIRSGLEVRV
jgi:ABC-type branched-subunit amino acid transport system ATPase component